LHPLVLVVLGTAAFVTAYASLLSSAHRGSDIVGGALLVGVFSFVACAIFGAPVESRKAGYRRCSAVGVGGVVLAIFVLIVGRGSADAIGFAVGLATGGVMLFVLANQCPLPVGGGR
jgi:hypothetical protein